MVVLGGGAVPYERGTPVFQLSLDRAFGLGFWVYRGTSLTKNTAPLEHYSRTMPRALWWS